MFSVGSIAYTAALSHARYNNNIARLTSNVLHRLLQPEPVLEVSRQALTSQSESQQTPTSRQRNQTRA